MVTLVCTVRNCRQPLLREGRTARCPAGHSFDIARSGYVNLLQPQDRRSKNPGDSKAAVAARRRFLDAGHGQVFAEAMTALLRDEGGAGSGAARILDVGCGEGYHLDRFRRALEAEGHGTDISAPAIDLAARRYTGCQFVIANADRFIPYADGSFDVLTSITARLNPGEFRRVLAPAGLLLVGVAGPDDLIELREAVLGERKLIDRLDRTAATFAAGFELVGQERVRHRAELDRRSIEDVMTSSYRGLRKRERERLEKLGGMTVTFSRDLLLFRARG